MTETIRMREFQHELRAAGRQVWLASLGAVATLEDGGQRFFEQMKTWSQEMEERRKKAAAEVEKTAAKIEAGAERTVAKIEAGAERTVAEAGEKARRAEAKAETWAAEFLHRFDVPTRRDFDQLEERIDELATVVGRWRGQSLTVASAPAVKKAAAETDSEENGRKILHVRPHDQGWEIAVEGLPRYQRLESTKKVAVEAAREIAKRHLPSQLVIHRQDGSVQTRSSYGEEA